MKIKIKLILTSALVCLILWSCNEQKYSRPENDPINYAIAYNVLVDGEKDNYDVFTMNFDGSDKKTLLICLVLSGRIYH